jgi:uncharacterized UBP type Zn finger protein
MACGHVKDLGPEPTFVSPAACEECHDHGIATWAHLRMCLTCGHVGCCDSSQYRHARAHFTTTGHLLMRSIEPGEDWKWCYVDKTIAT